jgi:hypothetical protein
MKQQERETLLIRDKMLIKRLATLEQNKIREGKGGHWTQEVYEDACRIELGKEEQTKKWQKWQYLRNAWKYI